MTLCANITQCFYFTSQQIANKTFIAIFAPVIGPFLENERIMFLSLVLQLHSIIKKLELEVHLGLSAKAN